MEQIVPIQKIIDLGIEENLVPNAKLHNWWYELGEWQLTALREFGLQPHHYLLDMGCGPMRLGIHAIPYLEDGHYFGIDAFRPYISLGQAILQECGFQKRYTVRLSSEFDFERFDREFDYGIGQSVFTHLSISEIRNCTAALKKAMKPKGQFLFTYIKRSAHEGFLYYGWQPMIRSGLSIDFLNHLAQENDIAFVATEMEHPTGQDVALFRF